MLPTVLTCDQVRKSFRSSRREPGFMGFVRHLVRRKGLELHALSSVSLSVEAGEFLGLIGANGAGKTTLVKCMTGIIPVSSGRATLLGRDAFHLRDADKARLSLVMGQRSQLWWDVPARDSFELLRAIYEIPRANFEARLAALAARLEVADRLDVQLRHLSLGQRMKMEIIGAFLHEPEIVFLDEPTIGLDLISRETIRQFLREVNREQGTTVILTSHDMEDIEQTCRRLVILDAGLVLFDGELVQLQRRLIERRLIEVHLEPGAAVATEALAATLAAHDARLVREAPLLLQIDVAADRSHGLIKALFDVVPIHDLAVERQPLENLVRQIFLTREIGSP